VTFVDSNVIIDVIERDENWSAWSLRELARATAVGPVQVSAVVAAEVAPRFESPAEFLEAMSDFLIEPEPLGLEAAFAAGTAFRRYLEARKAEGPKSLIADFLIGAHAQTLDASLLTRDPRFYRTYFPDLTLITPETHP
jgi:predicted nucleic acid-binding protein